MNLEDICKDPLFQINLVIWMAQPQSSPNYYVNPLFYKSGLTIYSIEPLLTLPPDIRKIVSNKKIEVKESVRPDLILKVTDQKKFCILECKASSFGPESSNSIQARTFLLMTGPIISQVLGIGDKNEGILCYFTGPNNSNLMNNTLQKLAKRMKVDTNLQIGKFGCLEINLSNSSILLEYSKSTKTSLKLTEESPVKILDVEKDTDPRPLYFIPYDPNIEQTKEEQEFCRRIFLERILSSIISKIGSIDNIPTSLTINTDELLTSATFGLYEIWDNSDTKKNIRKVVKDFLINIKNSINSSIRDCIIHKPQEGWTFNIRDKKTHEELLNQLQRFKPENIDLSKEIEPSLFDNLENEL